MSESLSDHLDLTEGFVARRTIGLGDSLFVLNALRAYKDEHPDTPVWFDPGPDPERQDLSITFPFLETSTPPADVWSLDFDLFPADLDGCRYALMAERLGVEATELRLPWAVSEKMLRRVQMDYPRIGEYVVLAPWCGGSAVTRSLPDSLINGLLAQDEFPILIEHPESHGAYDTVPDSVVGRCPLGLMVALVHEAKAVISVDTGTAYVAASMGVPTVVVYTHIKPEDRLLPQDNVAWVQPPAEVECAPCGDFAWPPKCPDGGLARCAEEISLDAILDALRGLV